VSGENANRIKNFKWIKRGQYFSEFQKGSPILLQNGNSALELLSAAFTNRFIHLALKGRHILAQGVEAQLQALG